MTETAAHTHDHHDPASPEIRIEALESLLVEGGVVETAKIDDLIRRFEEEVGPMNGARVVARAWTDADFKASLLADGTAAITELGLSGPEAQKVVVVENTPEVHNLVTCTLCSCYPWALLGLPPAWYKSPEYRARSVRDPRGVLSDFGTEIADDREVRVWDSSAEIRYLVLPMRPAGTDGMTPEELVGLVSRDAMVGVRDVDPPT